MSYAGKPTLKTLLGDYPKTRAIRDGVITPELSVLDIDPILEATKGFKRLVRGLEFDFAEVAIMTFLIGRDYGKPYALMPFVMNGNFHHGSIWYDSERGPRSPKDVEGARVGLRSYTQTTPTWVRGILANEYGVDLSGVTWVTFEDAHVEEYQEPSNVQRAPEGQKLAQMLLDGEIDFAMLGSGAQENPRLTRLIPGPAEAAKAWNAKTGVVPINHMMVVRDELLAERPDVVRELFGLLVKAREISGGPQVKDGINMQPVGLEQMRPALQMSVDFALQQKLIRSPVNIDDLFTDVTAGLTA
jgi:4,5-dihydroxyphthalate decarboxylase